MKQITFQIDDTGKVLVFPQDLTGDMLPEEQKFTAQDIKLIHDCLYNIDHHPQFYSITSKDFKNKTNEETLQDFKRLTEPEKQVELLSPPHIPSGDLKEENSGFRINTADGGALDLQE